jgi:autotransporter-associated beta strand protein
MKPRSFHRTSTTLAALLALQTVTSGSQPVPVNNAGFEAPVLADGGFQAAPIPGWSNTGTGDRGLLNPTTSDFTTEAPEGSNVAYVANASGEAGVSQLLGGSSGQLQVGATYSLRVKVGNSAFVTSFPGYRVQLLANGTVLAEDDNSLAPAEGAFVTSTVNYVYNASLHAALVGQPLEVRLLCKAIDTSEVAFDDVQLSATFANPIAVPGGPYSVFTGGSLVLNGTASLPSDGATITNYEWDIDDDGDYDEAVTGATPAPISDAALTSTYGMSLGGNTIRLRVTDSAAKTAVKETAVNILPNTALVYEPFNYAGTALNGASGTSEVGLAGTWNASVASFLGPNRAFGPLVTRGAGIGDLQTGVNRYGGRRDVNASALAANGLLTDGSTLWFSVIMGYDTGGNVTNSRLAFCLATEGFSTNNFAYYFTNAGATGIGVTLGNFGGNGKVVATQFRDSTFGASGFGGNVFATNPNSSPVLYAAGQSGLIVGKITWGAVNDTIELYNPGVDLVLPALPISTLTVNVDQSTFDTITWARGDKVVMDEIRFGASYAAVIETGSAWDLNGSTAGTGSAAPSGLWNADPNWNLASDGTLVPIPWQAGGVATFSAGNDATEAYTVTVAGTQDIGGILFEDGTVTLSGGTALRMTANTTVSVAPGLTATISTPFTENAADRQLAKAGAGTLILSGNNVGATGGMNLSAGVTQFESPAAINGTARNVTIGTVGTMMFGSGFGAGNIPTALLNRVTESSSGAIASDNYAGLDFDLNTAGLTAARLGAVGSVNYTGTLTPNGTTYRLGGGGGTLTMANTNALTGGNSLVVNGNVTLAGNNDYSGTTTINTGSTVTVIGSSATSAVTLNTPNTTLILGNNASLGAGTLTVANSFAGPGTLAAIGTIVTSNPVTAGTDVNFGGTGTLTLGGTITLANNVTITNNNTANPTTLGIITAVGGIRTLAFSGNGNTSVTGAIGGGTNISNLTKNGNGTLTLSAVNTHTGTTTVNNAGTLMVVSPGSLPAGAVNLNATSTLAGDGTIGGNVTVTATANIAPGNSGVGTLPITGNLTISAMAGSTGTLNYELGPIAASDKITVGGTLAIGTDVLGFNNFVFTGLAGLENGTYKLITTANPITTALDPGNVNGLVGSGTGLLVINGNDLELVVSGVVATNPYATWSGGAAPDIDTNGDGVDNGVAWVLGAADPNANAIGLLPTLNNTSDSTYVIFTFGRSDAANLDGNTAISVEYGSDLASWTTAVDDNDKVEIEVTPGSPTDTVVVKLKRSSLATGGKLFVRLKAAVTP